MNHTTNSEDIHRETIADKRIEWYVWGEDSEGIKELDDATREHIAKLVKDGFREGELHVSHPFMEDTDISGFWRLAPEPRHTLELMRFDSVQDVHLYVWSELLATLQDDLGKMEKEEAQHYTEEDRMEMRNRIADIRAVCPFEL